MNEKSLITLYESAKSYLIEKNFSINESLTLFYGENLGLKNLFQKKIKEQY